MLQYRRRSADRTYFPRPEDMPPALHQLLIERGVPSAEAAEAFLDPGPKDLHDPRRLGGMDAAAARIASAMEAGEAICVYGDYDVDGVCASAILSLWLQARGADARAYLPSRHHEGYGLNEGAVREIAGWARLMVTVDCGVTSVELVALARSLGLDVIVTDHHRPGEALPDCPVVNPLLADYPFPSLCGAGVAWKLAQALAAARGEDPEETAAEFVDIAALATVADVVPLTGENRAIVRMGLDRINAAPRTGIAALIEAAGLSGKRITSTAIAFQLAPRLNAGGRLGSAERSLRLVVARDPDVARTLAAELEAENTQRKQVERQILAEAEAQLADFDFAAHRALILSGKDWNPGVIGLAASRLVEEYHYPVVLLADQGERMTGSCRSIEGVDIHAALTGCASHLERFGGHRQAAGLTLLSENLDAFRAAMDAWLEANVDPNAYIPAREYDAELDFEAVTPGLIAALEAVQPTGFGNPAPVFRATAEVVEARAVGASGDHLKLVLAQGGHRLDAIAFREGGRADRLPSQIDALFAPKLNVYMGRASAQLELRAMEEADACGRLRANLAREARLRCDFLTEILYNKKIIPTPQSDGTASVDALRDWMLARPQGTLALTADLAAAEALLRALAPARPDLFIGELPDDPRAFNAVCVYPPAASPGRGYRRAVLAGVPEEYPAAAPEVFRLGSPPEWLRQMPDLDGLREAYRGLMRVGWRPAHCRTLYELAHMTADESGLEEPAALTAILAMADMGLFELTLDGGQMRIRRSGEATAEPGQSAVWQAIQRWRQEQ